MQRSGFLFSFTLTMWAAVGCSPATARGSSSPQPTDQAPPISNGPNDKSQPRVVGFYNNGCQMGAQPLPWTGQGYVFVRPSRNHHHGHAQTVAYVQRMANHAQSVYALQPNSQKILGIGDLSAEYGGKIEHHGSHRNGLDIDVPLGLFPAGQTPQQLESQPWISVVDWERKELNDQWDPRMGAFVLRVAEDPEVDRIFVNPVIKRALCQMATPGKGLRKVRSEWGHSDHMHVRLQCPPDSTDCKPQRPLQHDGCDEASFAPFFSPKPGRTPPTTVPPPPPPKQCITLWQQVGYISPSAP